MIDERPSHRTKAAVPSDASPAFVRGRLLAYLGGLILLLSFGSPSGGLFDIPISFVLKNRLHLEVYQLANFRLLCAVPLCFSGVFGFVRDIFNPFGMGDRGFIILFGSISAGLYFFFAFTPVTWGMLLAAVVISTFFFLFVVSAQSGLTASIAQKHSMTGQVSAAWNIFSSLPTVATLLLGGFLSNWLEELSVDQAVRSLFLFGAAIMVAVTSYSIWKPPWIFDAVQSKSRADPIATLKRLFRHRPIYAPLLIWLLWNFAPGSLTPLQYHLQNTLKGEDADWGRWNAIVTASFIPTFYVFSILCARFPLKTLLWWGTVIAIPQMVPLLFIHSLTGALLAAVAIGLMGGLATAAYLDLIIRSSPPGLEGTTLMMAAGAYFIASRFGDVLGAYLYAYFGGFTACVLAITAAYGLILPTLSRVSDSIITKTDGQKLLCP
jgi:hypothetical protein